MFRGNEEQVVSQKLRGGLDNLHAVSQVTLGLASLDWDWSASSVPVDYRLSPCIRAY